MATVQKRSNGTYKVTVVKARVGNKQIREYATFKPDPQKSDRQNEKALQRFIIEFEDKVKKGTSKGDALTFKEFSDKWLETYVAEECEKTTLQAYTTSLNTILPHIGYYKLSDLRPMTIANAINKLRDKGYDKYGKHYNYSEVTLTSIRRTVSCVLGSAVEEGLILSNPCITRRRRKKKEREEGTVKCFTPEQALYFMDCLSKPIPIIIPARTVKRNGNPVQIREYKSRDLIVPLKYRVLFTLAIYGGFRRGEIIGLTWNDVDFDRSTIRVRGSAHYIPGEQYDGNAKTKGSYRELFMPDVAMKLLKEYNTQQKEEMLLKGSAWEGDRKNGYIFTQENGLQMSIHTPNAQFKKYIRAINNNAPEDKRLPEIHLHELRHTNASILISEDLDPVTVAARLGHSDATTTLKIYSHAFKEQDKKAVDALNAAFNRVKSKVN